MNSGTNLDDKSSSTDGSWFLFNFVIVALIILALGISVPSCRRYAQNESVRIQTKEVALRLDTQTTEAGVYVRVPEEELPDTDLWGTKLRVQYAQGGVAETIRVTSAGRDKLFGTTDDISSYCLSTNLKGIGTGLRDNAEEASRNVAKGLVEGVKEGLKKK